MKLAPPLDLVSLNEIPLGTEFNEVYGDSTLGLPS